MRKRFQILSCLLIIMFLIASAANAASVVETLDRDISLHPDGWAVGTIKYKGGTQVTLNERGEVVSGIICDNEYLRPAGMGFGQGADAGLPQNAGRLLFKGGIYPVTFNDNGMVISGLLAEPANIYIVAQSDCFVLFKENTLIMFSSDGSVSQGTIADDNDFRPVGWQNILPADDKAGFIKFRGNTEVIFSKGEVIQGTIDQDLVIMLKSGGSQTYKAGSILQFDETACPKIVSQ